MRNKNNHNNQKHEEWITTINPSASFISLELSEIWKYRDLISLFIRRDFVSVYKQTILGPLWHIIKPLFTTLIFTIVFGRIARIPTDTIPPFLFYMAGNIMWIFFSEILALSSDTFNTNKGIFGKVYFPRMAVPIANCVSKLISFTIQFVIFIILLFYANHYEPLIKSKYLLILTPIFIIILSFLGTGLGIIVSSLTTKYKDLQVLFTFIVTLLMYATPIIYPISAVPIDYRSYIMLNPVAPLVEAFRFIYLGAGMFNYLYLLYSFLFSITIFFFGVIIFNKTEKNFIDTI